MVEEREVAFIYEVDAGYLFGMAHNKTKQVVRSKSKTRSEEEVVPSHGSPARVAVPLSTAGGVPPQAAGFAESASYYTWLL